METDGGGWTLVANVHEDNISKKCDSNDRWSAYASDSVLAGIGEYSDCKIAKSFSLVLKECFEVAEDENKYCWWIELPFPLIAISNLGCTI